MKILLTGASGQLGRELLPLLTGLGEVTPVDRAPGWPTTLEMDLADLDAVERLLDHLQPDLLVNAAAYTAVDRAESPDRAPFRLNACLPDGLARWCACCCTIRRITYSTVIPASRIAKVIARNPSTRMAKASWPGSGRSVRAAAAT
jgi:dTDP-4-dehydrorhamnose reductase